MTTTGNVKKATIILFGQEFIAASDFADIKGISESDVISMTREGFYDGRHYQGRWYVSTLDLKLAAQEHSQWIAIPSDLNQVSDLNHAKNDSIQDVSHTSTFDEYLKGEFGIGTSFMYFFFINYGLVLLLLKSSHPNLSTLIWLVYLPFIIVSNIAVWRAASKDIRDPFWAVSIKGLMILISTSSIIGSNILMREF